MSDSANVHVGEGKSRVKLRRQFVVILIVTLVFSIGAGGVVRWLTTRNVTPNKPTERRLPAEVDNVQNLRIGGNAEEAKKAIQASLNDPDASNEIKYQLYIQEGNIASDAKKPAEAAVSYEKAAAIQETFPIASLLGDTYALIPNKEKAIFWYRKAIPLVPKDNNPVYEDDVNSLEKSIARMEALP